MVKANIPKESIVIGNKEAIEIAEKYYSAVFIGDFCLRDKEDKYWINESVAVFYCEKPAKPEYTNYFALLWRNDTLFITAGDSAFKDPITGIIDEDGSFVHSRWRHDFRTAKNGCVIDGSRDYLKVLSNKEGMLPTLKTAKINKDHLEIIEDE